MVEVRGRGRERAQPVGAEGGGDSSGWGWGRSAGRAGGTGGVVGAASAAWLIGVAEMAKPRAGRLRTARHADPDAGPHSTRRPAGHGADVSRGTSTRTRCRKIPGRAAHVASTSGWRVGPAHRASVTGCWRIGLLVDRAAGGSGWRNRGRSLCRPCLRRGRWRRHRRGPRRDPDPGAVRGLPEAAAGPRGGTRERSLDRRHGDSRGSVRAAGAAPSARAGSAIPRNAVLARGRSRGRPAAAREARPRNPGLPIAVGIRTLLRRDFGGTGAPRLGHRRGRP